MMKCMPNMNDDILIKSKSTIKISFSFFFSFNTVVESKQIFYFMHKHI